MTTTTPNPAEQIAEEVNALRYDVDSLQSKVRLASIRDGIEDLETSVTGLEQKVKNLRARNYAFENGLEGNATNLASRWMAMKPSLQIQVNQQAMQLEGTLRTIEAQMSQLAAWTNNPAAARPLLDQIKVSVDNLESKASAAESTIRGLYDSFENELNTLIDHLDKVEWTLTQMDEATFPFLPTEAGIMAVKATWIRDNKEDKDDPQGVLLLTDQRILFEQKQEVATKKVLFITTQRQKVQQLLLETPVALVQGIKATKQGIFKNEDHLELEFASGAPVTSAHFHLDGQDCNLWQSLINRAKAKEFDEDRAIAVDQTVVEKVKAAPSLCPNCGGKITQVVMRGMDSITCEYCGVVIRL
jgi:hypothetical protein